MISLRQLLWLFVYTLTDKLTDYSVFYFLPIVSYHLFICYLSFLSKVRDVLVTEVELVKEYACLQGLLALDKENAGKLDEFHAVMTKVAATTPPVYT